MMKLPFLMLITTLMVGGSVATAQPRFVGNGDNFQGGGFVPPNEPQPGPRGGFLPPNQPPPKPQGGFLPPGQGGQGGFLPPGPAPGGNPAQPGNALSGQWLFGPIGQQPFQDSEGFSVTITDQGGRLTLTLPQTTYLFTQTPGLSHVYQFAQASKPIVPAKNKALVIVLSNNELLHVRGDEVRHVRRSRSVAGPDGQLAFDPAGVWSKGPANTPEFDPTMGGIFRYEVTPTGLKVTNREFDVAYWTADPTQRNTYRGDRIVSPDGTDVTPLNMNEWRLVQTSSDRMTLRANGATKYLIRVK